MNSIVLLPLTLELKNTLEEAKRCYPGYNKLTQLQYYKQVMEKTIAQASCDNIRIWAETRFAVCNTLISLYLVRNN